MRDELVNFDLLMRLPENAAAPSAKTIAHLRPDPMDLERCRRWLVQHGITAYDTGFGFACTMSRKQFESLFQARLEAEPDAPGRPSWRFTEGPTIPHEIAGLIGQITLSAAPELFG